MSSLASEAHVPGAATWLQDRYFRFACVSEPRELELTYGIRYQVYCRERGFLAARNYPRELETDEYDDHSFHVLAAHRAGYPAGTARLVMSSPVGFPSMRHCIFTDEYGFLNDQQHPALRSFGEVSRLAISKRFRRRQDDSYYGGPPRADSAPTDANAVVPLAPPRNTPEIMIGLCRVLYQESKRRGITHWLLAMEKSLFVMLKRMGFHYTAAGPEVDYYGPVRPYVASLENLEAGLHRRFPDTLAYLSSGLEPHLVARFVGESDEGPEPQETAA